MSDSLLDFILGNSETDNGTEDVAIESAVDTAYIVMEAIKDECANPEEANSIVMENTSTLQLYGVLPEDSSALEAATKIIKSKFTKQSRLSKTTKRVCYTLAKLDSNPHYDKYLKYRDLMRKEREFIFNKYESKAKREAIRILRGAKNNISNANTASSRQIEEKIDSAINKVEPKKD